MLTVEADAVVVEKRLCGGELSCPGCGGVLRPWGWAIRRSLRGEGGGRVWLRPRRACCAGCGATHVLLPVIALWRRADAAVVIGSALEARAAGWGHRPIAGRLGRPAETVRGWLRAFAAGAEEVRLVCTGWAAAVAWDWVPPPAAGSPVADAVAAVRALAAAVAGRWPRLGTLSPWTVAAAVTGGMLLAPPAPTVSINTSSPWAGQV